MYAFRNRDEFLKFLQINHRLLVLSKIKQIVTDVEFGQNIIWKVQLHFEKILEDEAEDTFRLVEIQG